MHTHLRDSVTSMIFARTSNFPSSAISNFPQKFAAGVNKHCGGALRVTNIFAMFQKIRNGSIGIIRSPDEVDS
jgi:hypothetical protein